MINLQKGTKTKNVYAVWWSNGELYRADEERKIISVFSTMENAEAYRDKWKDDYKNKCDAIATKGNYQQYADYKFEFYFPERVWIETYVLEDAL